MIAKTIPSKPEKAGRSQISTRLSGFGFSKLINPENDTFPVCVFLRLTVN